MDTHNDTSNRSNAYLNVYDAVWSIAFVLDKSRTELQKQGKILENLTYGDPNATNVFRNIAEDLDFATPNIGVRVRHLIPRKIYPIFQKCVLSEVHNKTFPICF